MASIDECRMMKNVFTVYVRASDHVINNGKFIIMCSSNVARELHEAVFSILEVYNQMDTYRYLGLPSLVCKKKISIFSDLRIVCGKSCRIEVVNRSLRLDKLLLLGRQLKQYLFITWVFFSYLLLL